MNSEQVLTSMHAVLSSFDSGDIHVKPMIDRLKALFWGGDDANEEWSDVFFKHWGMMEEVYALAAAKGLSEVDSNGTAHINEAVKALRSEIERRLGPQVARK